MARGLALTDRYLDWRDRLAGSAAFRRWTGRFPLTRWIARRHASALFDLTAGFVYSQVLHACVQLELFAALARGPQSLPALAAYCRLAPERCAVLLQAAVALRLLQPAGAAHYRLGMLGAALLENPALLGMIRHHSLYYRDLQDPVALLEGSAGGHLRDYWAYVGTLPEAGAGAQAGAAATAADSGVACAAAGAQCATAPVATSVAGSAGTVGAGPAPGRVADYSALMSQSQTLVADQLLDAYPFGRHRILLDVGGGEGTFARAALQRHPRLQAWVFDLPAVVARIAAMPGALHTGERLRGIGGDFRATHLPAGADLITLVRVLHDHDDAVVQALLRAVRRALPPGGVLLVAEPLAETPGARTVGDAYFAMYFLAMGSGRPRSFARYRELLLEAGFAQVRSRRTAIPLQASVIEARAAWR